MVWSSPQNFTKNPGNYQDNVSFNCLNNFRPVVHVKGKAMTTATLNWCN